MNYLNSNFKVKLDANESAYAACEKQISLMQKAINLDSLNRYPDPDAEKLISAYADYQGISSSLVIAGNGSDEILDIIFKAFTTPKDIVLSIDPSFVMYEIMSKIFSCQYRRYQPNDYYSLDVDAFIDYIDILKPSLLFICNPNNPTGAVISKDDVIRIVNSTDSIVVVDEAYGEFISADYKDFSMISEVENYQNLIVLKTLSKAYGLAGLRVGFGIANERLISKMFDFKYPYNISSLSQELAIACLTPELKDYFSQNQLKTIENRKKLEASLSNIEGLSVYRSNANFIWIKVSSDYIDIDHFIEGLNQSGIKIRSFKQTYLRQYLRITVGNELENNMLLACIESLEKVA